MFDWLKELWLGIPQPTPPAPPLRPLETLERRDNPATIYWQNVDSNYSNAANWSDGVPTPDDVLVFAPSYAPPIPDSPPPPPSGSNTSTTFVSLPPIPYAADTYAGIRIVDNYAGTLTIPFNITFGELTQTSGNTYTPGTDVTVDGAFSWTGGNTNTSSVAGVYHIQGVPMGIVGTDTSNISTGSKLSIETSSGTEGNGGIGSAVQGRGILNLLNTTGIEVAVGCLFQVNGNANGNAKHNMQAGATEVVKGMAIYCGVEINNGALIIDGNVKVGHDGTVGSLKVTGQVSPGTIGSPSVYIRTGKLYLLNREKVTVSHTVEMLHGEIRTLTRAGVEDAD